MESGVNKRRALPSPEDSAIERGQRSLVGTLGLASYVRAVLDLYMQLAIIGYLVRTTECRSDDGRYSLKFLEIRPFKCPVSIEFYKSVPVESS